MNDDPLNRSVDVNAGYPQFQLAKALRTQSEHRDEETQERAAKKVRQWIDVLRGMMEGTIHVGSRQPMNDIPVWATPEVAHGGFPTGRLLAAGAQRPHEQLLITRLNLPHETNRIPLNQWCLSDDGIDALQEMLDSGGYELTVPEEGALLVVAWLVRHGESDAARSLIAMLTPHFAQLRFYPVPSKRPQAATDRVHLNSVREAIDQIERAPINRQVGMQHEAIRVWIPLYDEMIRLFLETVEGETPDLERDENGRPLYPNSTGGKWPVVGGWPCQQYAADWQERAAAVLVQIVEARQAHRLCGRPWDPTDSFDSLHTRLQMCVSDPESLTGRDVGRVRLVLARYVAKRGVPDGVAWQTVRNRQAEQTRNPMYSAIGQVVCERLKTYPADGGLETVGSIIAPITEAEAHDPEMPLGTLIPESQQRKVTRCQMGTVDELVAAGVLTSSELIATLLPQMTAQIAAASIADPQLRLLYAAIYRAFRKRRSLLLLNLEKQVQINELPWVTAIKRHLRGTDHTKQTARQAAQAVVSSALRHFPHTILPNPLLQEVRTLLNAAGLNKVPIVEELAADIFMGAFSSKFTVAAQDGARLLNDTVYARYYAINYNDIMALPVLKTDQAFARVCLSRAGVTEHRYHTTENGMVIEQQQIVTTQNLATLFTVLDLRDVLQDGLLDMAQRCFAWVCQQHQVTKEHRARLHTLKNTAYAWRQMVFYLAVSPAATQAEFLTWAEAHLAEQDDRFVDRMRPVLDGLRVAMGATALSDTIAPPYTGWAQHPHWFYSNKK